MKKIKYCLQTIIIVWIYFQNITIFSQAANIQDKWLNVRPIHVVRADGTCPGKKPILLSFVRGVKANTKSVFIANYTLLAKENLPDKLFMTITLSRCLSRENLDSCEEFYKQQNIDYCQFINPDTMVPNPLIIPVEPKFKCPIEKGTYRALNLTYNLTPFLLFDLGDWYWKANVEFFPARQYKVISCMICEGYVEHRSKT